MSVTDKDCVIFLDEIKLEKSLNYNKYHDFVEGFEDF